MIAAWTGEGRARMTYNATPRKEQVYQWNFPGSVQPWLQNCAHGTLVGNQEQAAHGYRKICILEKNCDHALVQKA